MIIKNKDFNAIENKIGLFFEKPIVRIAAGFSLLVIAVLLGVYRSDVSPKNTGYFDEATPAHIDLPSDLLEKIPVLHFEVKDKHLKKLKDVETRIKEDVGVLFTNESNDDFVPAVVKYDNKTVRTKLRLKGNWLDARQSNKWSVRVVVKDDETVMGMQRFSLHDPIVKNYLSEWTFHKLLRFNGLIALRYQFVRVVVNGMPMGIHGMEEHFDKRLLANNNRREGPIMGFEENWHYYFKLFYYRKKDSVPKSYQELLWSISPTKAFGADKYKNNPRFVKDFNAAKNLLELLRMDKLKIHEVFESKDLAKLIALADVIGNRHSLFHRNIKFYYNSITSKLEPIGYDNHGKFKELNFGNQLLPNSLGFDESTDPNVKWLEKLFSDPVFTAQYVHALEEMIAPGYIEKMIEAVELEYHKAAKILESENIIFPKDHFALMKLNRDFIERHVYPLGAVQVFYNGVKGNKTKIQIRNFHVFPVEVTGYKVGDQPMTKLAKPIFVDFKKPYKYMPIVDFDLPANVGSDKLKIEYHVIGTTKFDLQKVNWWSAFDKRFPENDVVRLKPTYKEFDFVRSDEGKKIIVVKSGNHRITKNLVFPPDYSVVFNPGAQIDLANNASIISFSAVLMEGTKTKAITIYSKNSDGQGMAVISAGQESLLRNVRFSRLSPPQAGLWELSGGVTFYKSPVKIQGVGFYEARGEDGLNIVQSKFSIMGTVFNKTEGDSLDVDFGQGVILNSNFLNAGNDAIDVSGTEVKIDNVSIKNAKDKAISAGELSMVIGGNINIQNFNIGVASKDKSQVILGALSLNNGRYGLTAFQKKTEFGPGYMEIDKLTMGKIGTPHLLEEGSMISVSNEKLRALSKNVRSILYPKE